MPEFGEPITNLTVPIGRDATFECIVVNLGNFRVRELPSCRSLSTDQNHLFINKMFKKAI